MSCNIYCSSEVHPIARQLSGEAKMTQGNRLEGKVAIVTGAGATGSGEFVGIGQAISLLFARQGAKVLLVDRDEKNAEITLCLLYTSPSPRDLSTSRMPSSA